MCEPGDRRRVEIDQATEREEASDRESAIAAAPTARAPIETESRAPGAGCHRRWAARSGGKTAIADAWHTPERREALACSGRSGTKRPTLMARPALPGRPRKGSSTLRRAVHVHHREAARTGSRCRAHEVSGWRCHGGTNLNVDGVERSPGGWPPSAKMAGEAVGAGCGARHRLGEQLWAGALGRRGGRGR